MIRSIHHTAISTADMQRALEFYCGLLGFEQIWTRTWEIGDRMTDRVMGLQQSSGKIAMLALGDSQIEMFEFRSPEPQKNDPNRPVCNHGITHLCFEVTDLDGEYARLKAAGMHFHCPPQDDGAAKVTYGRDPDGNVIELVEMKAME